MMSIIVSTRLNGCAAWRVLAVASIQSLFFVLLAGSFSSDCMAAAEPIGYITHIQGPVMVKKMGAENPAQGVQGDALFAGDVLQTGPKALAQLTFSDDTFINLAEDTSLRVNQYAYEENGNRRTCFVKVLQGIARVIIRKQRSPDSLFLVESACARIAMNSLVDVALTVSPAATQVIVLQGSVSVRSTAALVVEEVAVGADQMTSITEKQPPTAPVLITPDKRKNVAIKMRRLR